MGERLRTTVVTPREQTARATVSVVIPCYNYARYLPEAVGSVLAQHDVDVEVIVVDDASSDDSVAVARALAARDDRVTVLVNEQNSGPVPTFNRGLDAAMGEYLVRLDADDALTPGSLSRAVALMQAVPSVGLVYGHPVHFSGDARPSSRDAVDAWYVWKGHDWLAVRCAAATNVITSPEAVMRKSVVDLVGGQRDLAHTHDMEMWLRIAARSDVAYIAGADQAFHRDHATSLSTKASDPLVILTDIRQAFDVLFDDPATAGVPRARLHDAARAAVAGQALNQAARFTDRGVTDPAGDRLLTFARETSPAVTATAEWRRADRMRVSPSAYARTSARAFGIVRRVQRRLADARRSRRWDRGGVYEPLQIVAKVGAEGVAR